MSDDTSQPRRSLRIYVSVLIVLFWVSMLGLFLWQEYFSYLSPTQQTSYKDTLSQLKERKNEKLLVYYGENQRHPIGYIESISVPQPDGTYELNTRAKLSLSEKHQQHIRNLGKMLNLPELSENKVEVGMHTHALIGPDYQLKDLSFRLKSNLFDLACEGKMKTGRLDLKMEQNGEVITEKVPLSSGTMAVSSFEPISIPKKLKVGQKFQMKWFDVVSQKNRYVKAEVKGTEEIYWDGAKQSVHVVHTDFGRGTSVSWINKQGEVLKYQMYGFTFKKEPERREKRRILSEQQESSQQTPGQQEQKQEGKKQEGKKDEKNDSD